MSRPAPPQGAPVTYGLVTRVYKRSLRPVILTIASLACLWTLFSGIGNFHVLSNDRNNGLPKIIPFAIATGALYLFAAAIEALGVAAAATQRLPLIRLYAYGSVGAALAVVANSVIEVVTHFTLKNDLIKACADITEGDVIYNGWGWWGPRRTTVLDAADALLFCKRAWDHDSVSTVVSLLIMALLAFLHVSVALAYLHQTLDPSSMRTFTTTTAYPAHYAPPFQGAPEMPYRAGFAPPPGPPAQQAPQQVPPPGGFAPPAGPPPDVAQGYGVGAKSAHDDDKDDPFADFERVPERDIASRPAPGGSDRFHV